MTRQKKLNKETKKELVKRLTNAMTLFNENHKYLAYAIFILRKRPIEEQISLFGM